MSGHVPQGQSVLITINTLKKHKSEKYIILKFTIIVRPEVPDLSPIPELKSRGLGLIIKCCEGPRGSKFTYKSKALHLSVKKVS